MKKNYSVAIEHKEETILKKTFFTLCSAQRWACKMVGEILTCDTPATIININTGEVMNFISR